MELTETIWGNQTGQNRTEQQGVLGLVWLGYSCLLSVVCLFCFVVYSFIALLNQGFISFSSLHFASLRYSTPARIREFLPPRWTSCVRGLRGSCRVVGRDG